MSPLDNQLQRVRDAYLDRPGMGVTPSQAQRLFGMAPQMCVDVLTTLLDEAFLLRTSKGSFVRRADRMRATSSD
jgi:hypothetical protein